MKKVITHLWRCELSYMKVDNKWRANLTPLVVAATFAEASEKVIEWAKTSELNDMQIHGLKKISNEYSEPLL